MPGYSKVPDAIRAEAQSLADRDVVIGAMRTFGCDATNSGVLRRLGIHEDGQVQTPRLLPGAEVGRWSRWNLEGRTVTRRDLPKVEKDFGGWSTPNFGDPSRGEHYVSFTRQVFQKQTLHGKQLELCVEASTLGDGRVRIGVRVDRVFKADEIDTSDFHMALSLVREVLAEAHIYPASLTQAEWLADQAVAWDLLPVGDALPRNVIDEAVERLGAHLPPDRYTVALERHEAMRSTGYSAVIVGREGNRRYVGYQFRQDLVVLENLEYGNALFVLYENWEEDSQKPRLELVADADAKFDRIVHTSGWQGRLAHVLAQHGHKLP